MRWIDLRSAGVALAMGLGTTTAAAQCPELWAVTPSDTDGGEEAGWAVALAGDLAVVGAPHESLLGTEEGAVYVYRFNGSDWLEEAKLSASDATDHDGFGLAVDTDGTRIVVGAPESDAGGVDSGAAYVFVEAGGSWVQEVQWAGAATGDLFGSAVAVDGDQAWIGAPSDDTADLDSGAVYAYRRAAGFWFEEQQILLSTAEKFECFGLSLDLDGTTGLIGAPEHNSMEQDAGSAFVFRYSSGQWHEGEELFAADGAQFDDFGFSVSLRDGLAVIGAPFHDGDGVNKGACYVFAESGGVFAETQRLADPDTGDRVNFGYAVATDGETIVVGSPFSDLPVTDVGAAYSFTVRKGEWRFDQKLQSASADRWEFVGSSVAVDDHRALVGATGRDLPLTDTGAGLLFRVDEFLLTAEPSVVSAGDDLDFDMFCGKPGTPAFFCVWDINGTPFFQVLLRSAFGADHHLRFSTTVPTGLSGLDLGFIAFRIDAHQKVEPSNLARVQFN